MSDRDAAQGGEHQWQRDKRAAARKKKKRAQKRLNKINKDPSQFDYINYKTGKKEKVNAHSLLSGGSSLEAGTDRGQAAGSIARNKAGIKNAKFNKRYNEDPEYREWVQENRNSGNLFERLGDHAQSMGEGFVDMVKKGAPMAAAMGGMVLTGGALNPGSLGGLFAGGGGASAAGGLMGGAAGPGGVYSAGAGTLVGSGASAGTAASLSAAASGAANLGAGASLHGAGTGGNAAGVAAGQSANAASAAAATGGVKLGGSQATTRAAGAAAGGGGSSSMGSIMDFVSSDIGGSLLNTGLDLYGQSQQQDALDDGFDKQNPWTAMGGTKKAGNQLMKLMDDPSSIEDTPGYQFAYDQGMKGLKRTHAAQGNRLGGRALTESMQFGQGLASQMWNQEMNRYAGLAGANQAISGGTAYGDAMASIQDSRYKNIGSNLEDIFRSYS